MITHWHRIVLRTIRMQKSVDLRERSAAFRQRVIDLAMHEPALVEIDPNAPDAVVVTAAGARELEHIPELT